MARTYASGAAVPMANLRAAALSSCTAQMKAANRRLSDGGCAMPHFTKPSEGSWTRHYPGLGTAPVSYEDSISPGYFAKERDAIFHKSWLNVGRIEQLPRIGSYFSREIAVTQSSIIIVKDVEGRGPGFPNTGRDPCHKPLS